MKPAVCCLCGKSALEEHPDDKGDWVEFRDYEQHNASLSHPIGLEYFCNEHISEANRLKHKNTDEALAELTRSFPSGESSVAKTNHKPSWWRRLIKG